MEGVKLNHSLEKLQLNFNNVNEYYLTKINERMMINYSERQKRKMPKYKQQIQSINISENQIDDVEWKIEQIQQERHIIENEIHSRSQEFIQVKLEESNKYNELKVEYEKVMALDDSVNNEIEDLNGLYERELKRSESEITEMKSRLDLLNSSIGSIEKNSMIYNYI